MSKIMSPKSSLLLFNSRSAKWGRRQSSHLYRGVHFLKEPERNWEMMVTEEEINGSVKYWKEVPKVPFSGFFILNVSAPKASSSARKSASLELCSIKSSSRAKVFFQLPSCSQATQTVHMRHGVWRTQESTATLWEEMLLVFSKRNAHNSG